MATRKQRGDDIRGEAPVRDEELRELESIKRLLILLLAKLGADSNEIGMALDTSPSTVRNWISFTKVTPIPLPREAE